MDAGIGKRIHFQVIATTTPKLLVESGTRQALVIVNAAAGDVYLGASGTLATQAMVLGTGLQHFDLFSSDEWWVKTASSSGTVSGYLVI